MQVLKEDDQLKLDLATQIVQKFIERERVPTIASITFSNVLMAVPGSPRAEAPCVHVGRS